MFCGWLTPIATAVPKFPGSNMRALPLSRRLAEHSFTQFTIKHCIQYPTQCLRLVFCRMVSRQKINSSIRLTIGSRLTAGWTVLLPLLIFLRAQLASTPRTHPLLLAVPLNKLFFSGPQGWFVLVTRQRKHFPGTLLETEWCPHQQTKLRKGGHSLSSPCLKQIWSRYELTLATVCFNLNTGSDIRI